MPGLALIADEFSDRVGFLTVLIGMDTDRDPAVRITENVNASFITINANGSVFDAFGEHFSSGYIPEALIIDGEGNIVENIVGGDEDEYRALIEKALNS